MSLIPPVRSLASKYTACCFKLVAVMLLLGKIMPTYSRYIKKGLMCIAIIALFSYQPSSYTKCTKLNMRLSCDVYSMSDTKYIFLTRLINL